jgi:intron-binding protein aquarius
LEFFIDLEAQLATRRFFNTFLDDHEITVLTEMAPFMRRENKDVDLLKKLSTTLAFYSKFEINDQTGVPLTDLEMTEAHCQQLIHLQVKQQKIMEVKRRKIRINIGSIIACCI